MELFGRIKGGGAINKHIAIILSVTLFAFVVGIFGYVSMQFGNAAPRSNGEEKRWELIMIEAAQKDLKGTLDPEMRAVLEERILVLSLQMTDEANGKAAATAAGKTGGNCIIPTPKSRKTPIRITGIIENPSVPSIMFDEITNGWNELIGNRYVMVLAGFAANEKEQGILYINIYPLDKNEPDQFVTRLAPRKSGKIRITRADGLQLTLKSEKGDVFYFDAPSLTFIESIGKACPTITQVSTVIPTKDKSNPCDLGGYPK